MSKKSDAVQFLESLGGGPLTFGRLIQSIRLGEEKSLDEFAKTLDVSRTNLSDIEHGRRGVSIERAAEWAKLLGYDQEQFVSLVVQQEIDDAGLALRVFIEKHSQAPEPRAASTTTKRTKVA